MHAQGTGPDLALLGAARSGTSYLASVLAEHPRIDGGAVKEPNFFSREFERGAQWYDGLFEPRSTELLRMDASMSYTFPEFPGALARLAESSPQATLLYAVREPTARALSHYQLNRHYFRKEKATDFGTALRTKSVYAGAGDYERWLAALAEHFPASRTLVIPFRLITTEAQDVATVICRTLGIEPLDAGVLRDDSHRNDVVAVRHTSILKARRLIKRGGAYPLLRRALGADRLRQARALLTRPVVRQPLDQALATCTDAQLSELDSLYTRSQTAVARVLEAQDAALGLSWSEAWAKDVPVGCSAAKAALQRSAAGEQ
jgi:hypothetical protein